MEKIKSLEKVQESTNDFNTYKAEVYQYLQSSIKQLV